MSIPMLLNVGLSGVPFAGVDVGGFAEDADAELLARWYQVGIFYPFLRNHCRRGQVSQEPWAFGAATEACIRRLLEARYQLLPYIETLFAEHRETGAPLMRPLHWHYPDDAIARPIDDQFLFGQDLLVAPIVARGQERRPVYLPAGLWHPFDGGRPLRGPGYHSLAWPLDRVPALVRDGAILPLAGPVQHTGELPAADLVFRVFGGRALGRYWQDDGSSPAYERGEYNDWQLSFARGRFVAKAAKLGYRAPKRRYFYESSGVRRQIARFGAG
jgi:alpha-glucosidase